MKLPAIIPTAAALSAALLAFAGWEIGSVTVKTRDTPAPAGYQTVSVEAVSGSATTNPLTNGSTHVSIRR